jgi:hypothetical protein
MPLVCREDLTVINSIGRLEMLAEKGAAFAPVVFVTEDEAEFARAMMNLLSMDFDIHTRYADMLRFNSFRRARRVRRKLGNGFIFATHGAKPCKDFDIARASDRARWIKEHGTTILDFGAGHLTETFLLRQAGIDCTPIEPYRLGPGGINKAESVELTREFLAEVAAGKEWTSIFIASVLNSVPFREDREHIACLCAALCKPFTKVYACASSAGESGWRQVTGKAFMNESNAGNIAFRLDYEPGIRIGDFQDKPKVQKYHTVAEFRDLFGPLFRTVKVDDFSNNINAACASARPVDPARLRTLDRIEEQTGWRPDDACFAPKGWWNPPAIKEHLLRKEVFPVHGEDARYIAIESNPRTREMYARFSIPCFWVTEEGTCLTEGTRIVKRLAR